MSSQTNHEKLMKKIKVLREEITQLEWDLKHEVLSIPERVEKRQLIKQLNDMIEVHINELPGLK